MTSTPSAWFGTERAVNEQPAAGSLHDLIHTCQLCGANSFEYLIELQRHAAGLAAHPADWMPWNYRDTLAAVGVS